MLTRKVLFLLADGAVVGAGIAVGGGLVGSGAGAADDAGAGIAVGAGAAGAGVVCPVQAAINKESASAPKTNFVVFIKILLIPVSLWQKRRKILYLPIHLFKKTEPFGSNLRRILQTPVQNDMSSEILVLIRRSLAGDDTAFEQIFHAYKNLVFKTAYLILGNMQETEDALQEVFIDVHRGLGSYAPEKAAFTTWLYRITVNYCLSWKRKARFFFLAYEDVSVGVVDVGQSAHEWRTEEFDEVWRAIRKLGAKHRAVLVMRFYSDLSYAEIASVLDVPVGTVKSRMNQALMTLRADLETAPSGVVSAKMAACAVEVNS